MGNPFTALAKWHKVRHEVKFLKKLARGNKATARRERTAPLIWEGFIVGQVEDLKTENWFQYGKWHPATSCETQRFLNVIECSGEAVVFLGDEKEWSMRYPKTITLKLRFGRDWSSERSYDDAVTQ